MQKLRQLLVYCGVSGEEYNSVKKQAYVSNFRVWKYLHIFIALAYLAFFVVTSATEGLDVDSTIKLSMFFYCVVVIILFFSDIIKEDSLAGQLIIYLTMIFLLISTFYFSLWQPEMTAVSFVILLVLLPMFMIDRPFYMAIVLALAAVIYLLHARMYKTDPVLLKDTVNVIAYALLGIVINTFYNTLRVKEFLLSKKAQEHIEEQKKSMEETERLNAVLQKVSERLVEILGEVVESRDADSGDHVQRVKGYTNILANRVMADLPEYGLDSYRINLMTFASSLHDVGKISIPDSILLKPDTLTPEEFEIMKTHCEKGCNILRKMEGSWSREYLDMGMNICAFHHEKWDGGGYPNGLRGDEIPIEAQIVSIADAYDALTSERPYKGAYSCDTAYSMIMNGECGAFSDKLLRCFAKCREQFEEYTNDPFSLEIQNTCFKVVSKNQDTESSFVIGFHDQTRTLRENMKLNEELSVVSSLAERFYYICYIDMKDNEVFRFRADRQFTSILDSIPEDVKSNERFDTLLNTVIVADDYESFREETNREKAMQYIAEHGHKTVQFRIRLEDGVHHCKMKITPAPGNSNAMIIGITNSDEEYRLKRQSLDLQKELEETRKEIEIRDRLQEQLTIINCVSSEYDYVCALKADTMEVTEYRVAPWMRDMMKNMDELVVSPEARERALKSIIYPDDFQYFLESSLHPNVVEGLRAGNGIYCVDYRAYKYGKLVHYQTRYATDSEDPNRIVIGLHSIDDYVSVAVRTFPTGEGS